MRKLVTSTFVTLDGVMQAPGGPEEDRSGGFQYGGWSVNYWDDMMGKAKDEEFSVPFELLLGRKTYEIFAAYWPSEGKDDGIGKKLNAAVKHVASRTLSKLTWNNSRLIEGDVAAGVSRLKQQDGPELQVHGSGNLIQTLIAAGLVDELRVWIFPVTVGKGKRLFADGTPPSGLKLVDTKSSTTGVLLNTFKPAGALQTGTFAADQPSEAEQERRQKVSREKAA
jgi:dihydrofolate reductase